MLVGCSGTTVIETPKQPIPQQLKQPCPQRLPELNPGQLRLSDMIKNKNDIVIIYRQCAEDKNKLNEAVTNRGL